MDAVLYQVNQLIKTYFGPNWDLGLLISKALGYGIITGSLLVKVPQILKIVKSKSAESVSPTAIVLEIIGLTITLLVGQLLGNPFSTYGESLFILVQSVLLLVSILHYSKKLNSSFLVGTAVYLGLAYAVVKNSSPQLLAYLSLGNIPIFTSSKIPQIATIHQNKSVGQLSLITCALNFAGCLARVFTTFKEVNEPSVLLGYVIGTVLNGTILAQFLLYRNNKVPQRRIVQTKKMN
ncbi:transmembrane protein [Tieghemostelium lacteum]|uniref:Mannose-P-dolichol utilization defect 1 protein homolog n=1 Tax=Tieghemostelium lacteum TaxID=361077 RepID=A0A151ZJV3_TIELA|nr:transmembrane protein [Tieghemostelium lacteum]|eukprot:KYQ94278.1 transmembrane protein [Tieghemostelium lacteum]